MEGSVDPTELWLRGSTQLGVAEHVLAPFLLSAALFFQLLAETIYNYRDEARPVEYKVVRTRDELFAPANSLGYSQFRGKYIQLDSLPLVHYLDEGKGPETILLLHGEPFWSLCWVRLIPRLVDLGYRVIAPDFIGFGKSDKLVDFRSYNVSLHKDMLSRFLRSLKLGTKVTLVGHNWGWMIGAAVAKDLPGTFCRHVILNTNNLPDGELDPYRFRSKVSFVDFLVANSFFLSFRALMNLLREYFPLGLLVRALNMRYTSQEVEAFLSPWPTTEYLGGVTAFPLLVPVLPTHPEAREMSAVRRFLAKDKTPTLIAYSDYALLPWLSQGDFVVGNRALFYRLLIPNVRESARIQDSGHLVMYDQPVRLAALIHKFILAN